MNFINWFFSLFKPPPPKKPITFKDIMEQDPEIDLRYSWLWKEKSPRILVEALAMYGVMESKGKDNNPVILEWAKEIGGWIEDYYDQDSIPWCGLFIAVCAKRAGFRFGQKALGAKNWTEWGQIVKTPMLGDVLIFTRNGGGHVGLYIGEDNTAYHVLGGNQSDMVNITRIRKERLHAVRRCKWKYEQPKNIRSIKLSPYGKISENEA